MSAGLTPQQSRLLRFIQKHTDETGAAPTFMQMADDLGLVSKGNIHALLTRLEARGRIRRLPHQARSIEVVTTVKPSDLAEFSTMDLRRELVRRQEGPRA